MGRGWWWVVVVLVSALSSGCAHTVKVESTPPGAEVTVQGQRLGKTPLVYNEVTGMPGPVTIHAKLGDQERTIAVERKEIEPTPIIVGAGLGALNCAVAGAVTVVWLLIVPPCAILPFGMGLVTGAGPPALGWYFMSHKLPDTVKIDFTAPPPQAGTAPPPPTVPPGDPADKVDVRPPSPSPPPPPPVPAPTPAAPRQLY